MRIIFSCDIAGGANIGQGTEFKHNALGCVISSRAIIGRNCDIYQHVTIGAGKNGYPTIGDNVTIYPSSTIIGNIRVGDGAVIGANSFVNKDIPSNAVVGGVPAQILHK